MAGNKTKPSKMLQAKYGAYKASNALIRNAAAKLQRHLKKFPNDLAAQEALKNVASKKYKKPSENKVGWIQKVIKDHFEDPQNPQTTVTKQRAIHAAKVISFLAKAPRLGLPVLNTGKDADVNPIVLKFEPVQTKKMEEAPVVRRAAYKK